MLLFNVTDYGITIASFGATIFMILSDHEIKLKKIFGSYLVATFLGYVFTLIDIKGSASIAAIASIMVMTYLEFQHTPAIGMTVAMVLNKFPLKIDLIVLISIFVIVAITVILSKFIHTPDVILKHFNFKEEKIKWNMKNKEYSGPTYIRLQE